MVRVVAKNYLQKGNIEAAAPIFRELIAETRKEAGCVEYRLHIDREDPTVYVFIEEWQSQAALDEHMASEHFKRLFPQIGELCEKPGDVLIMGEFV